MDISLLKSLVMPQTNLKDGIKKTLDYYKKTIQYD